MQEFIKNLEQKYKLTQTEKKEISDFRFSPRTAAGTSNKTLKTCSGT